MSDPSDPAARSIRLWDWPVRITHWSIVLLLPAMWWTAEERDIETHSLLGSIFLGLIAFRLLWGVFGSAPARFRTFLNGPAGVLAYLRGKAQPAPGHNPLGGWSVILLLGLIALQIGLGLFAQDVDGMESGPLSYWVSYDAADAARIWHERVFNLLLALVALHIAAVLFHQLLKGDNLIGPMLTGRKDVGRNVPQPAMASALAFVLCAAAAAAFSWWIFKGAPLPF